MSSETVYLLEGDRTSKVVLAYSALSRLLHRAGQAGQVVWSVHNKSFSVRVAEDQIQLVERIIQEFGLRKVNLAEAGRKHIAWARAQVKKHPIPDKKGNQWPKAVKPEEIWSDERCAPRNFRFEGAYTNLGVHRSTEWREARKLMEQIRLHRLTSTS